jgi:hypothetical protein
MAKPTVDHVVKTVSIDVHIEQTIKVICDAQLIAGYSLVNTCCYSAPGGPNWIVLIFRNG